MSKLHCLTVNNHGIVFSIFKGKTDEEMIKIADEMTKGSENDIYEAYELIKLS